MSPGLTLAFSTRSAGPQLVRYLRHLRRSCGVERLEILYRVNPGRWPLSTLYNDFLAAASHEVVCLLHDDLRFARGSNWGRRLLEAFARWPEYAVLGPAGGLAIPDSGIYWTAMNEMVGEVRHRLQGRLQLQRYSAPSDEPLDVLVLDGLLLAVHRRRIAQGFDERLRGFHFYDMAFTLAQSLAHQGPAATGKCGALTGLGVTHLSGGNNNHLFFEQRDAFVALYGAVLPRQLRPSLRLRPLRVRSRGPQVELLLRWPADQPEPAELIQRLQDSAYSPLRLRVLNGTGRSLTADVPELRAGGSWAQLNGLLLELLKTSAAELVLLLDSRVMPLQDWVPAMVANFTAQPRLGTLGVRLHYADDHLVAHNGLTLFRHPDGRPDVAIRGIHTPYPYRNALEWVPAGSAAQALMLRRELFLKLGGIAGQDWLPGLELNLLAAAAGWRNAVDSRLAGYLLEEDPADEVDYRRFLQYFAGWWRARPQLQRAGLGI